MISSASAGGVGRIVRGTSWRHVAIVALTVQLVVGRGAEASDPVADPGVRIEVLSNRADLVSGGDALVRVSWASAADSAGIDSPPKVTVDGRHVTDQLSVVAPGVATGLITGLAPGDNLVEARLPDGTGARLTVTNHPKGGPVFAGPQVMPWVCTTKRNGLGAPTDDQCNAPTKVSYLYQPTGSDPGRYEPYDPEDPPADVAETTTDDGLTVPYVVRLEEGTVDRAIYHVMVLADPARPWTAIEPQPTWNHKLWVAFSGGCGTMHRQWSPDPWFGLMEGAPSEGQISQHEMLSRGWMTGATGMNTLNYNCNEVVSAEALMMMKEIIVESYGPIRRTISVGNSGGAVQQHNIAASYPGILDGIVPSQSFGDLWNLVWDGTECYLLERYFTTISPHLWADVDQRLAVTGKGGLVSCAQFVAMFGDAFDPQNRGPFHNGAAIRFGCEIPPTETYHPLLNPTGARCAVQDYQRAIWGHGGPLDAAPLPYDNTGVQYGLEALRSGQITAEQFVDLNEKVGGLDTEGEHTLGRSAMSEQTAVTMHRAGRTTDARQLARVPIIDIRAVVDEEHHEELSDLHQPYHSHVTRARLLAANGTYGNQVFWRMVPHDMDFEATFLIDAWLDAVDGDTSSRSREEKILRHRPEGLVDTCWIDGRAVTDSAVCDARYPHAGDARTVAGGPLTSDVRKCQLVAMDRGAYPVSFTRRQWQRLMSAFASGVCDWSRPGIGFQPSIPWMSYSTGPGGTPLGDPPVSTPL